jgi:hypothetical protein
MVAIACLGINKDGEEPPVSFPRMPSVKNGCIDLILSFPGLGEIRNGDVSGIEKFLGRCNNWSATRDSYPANSSPRSAHRLRRWVNGVDLSDSFVIGTAQVVRFFERSKNRTARAVPLLKSTRFGTSPEGDRATHSCVNRGKKAEAHPVEIPRQPRIFSSPALAPFDWATGANALRLM